VLWAYELGYKSRPLADLTTSISTFYNVYDKLRSLEVGPPFHLANGAAGRTYGVEAEGTFQASRRWRLSAGYTFLRILITTDPTSTDTQARNQEGDSPRHQAFGRSSFSLPHNLTLDVAARYVDKLPHQSIPAYTAFDGRLAWQPERRAEIAVVGQGLFDSRHPEFGTPANRREIGRSLYGKATWWF